MKKLIVLPGANEEFMMRIARQIRDMKDDETLILSNDIKIYDIDNAEIWSKEQVKEFVESYGMKLDEKK